MSLFCLKLWWRKWLKGHHHLSNNAETTNHFNLNLQSEQYKYFMKQLLDTIVVVKKKSEGMR